MTNIRFEGRFHVVYILQFLRKGLVLCLLPMVQALLQFDLPSLYTALKQDAAILLIMAAVAVILWRQGGWQLSEKALTLRFGFISWRKRLIPFDQVAVLEQDRPLWLRILGATRVTLYAAKSSPFQQITFYLNKHSAALLAEKMLPTESDAVFFAPSRGEKLRFTMLSANLATSLALLTVSARQTSELLDANTQNLLSHLALDNFTRFEQLAELFLPAGLAWLFTLICMLWGLALLSSFLSTAGYKVSRSGGVILACGGHVHHSERRVRSSAVSYCDVRQSPAARLLRRFPVYLCAGSFSGGNFPFVVYKKGEEDLLQALVPDFQMEALDPGSVRDRSWPMFLWKGGIAFGTSAVLVSVSLWQLPNLTPVLMLPLFLSLGLLLSGLEARFCEGISRQSGGSLRVCYTRNFTRHDLCILTQDVSYTIFQSPRAESIHRCSLYLWLPCRQKLRVRGVKRWQARRLMLLR